MGPYCSMHIRQVQRGPWAMRSGTGHPPLSRPGRGDPGPAELLTLPATGRVYIGTSSAGVLLSAAQREEFGRAYIAASWAAEGRVPSA